VSPDQLQINRHLRQAAEKHVRAYIEEKDRRDGAAPSRPEASAPLVMGEGLYDDVDTRVPEKRPRDDSRDDRDTKRPRY